VHAGAFLAPAPPGAASCHVGVRIARRSSSRCDADRGCGRAFLAEPRASSALDRQLRMCAAAADSGVLRALTRGAGVAPGGSISKGNAFQWTHRRTHVIEHESAGRPAARFDSRATRALRSGVHDSRPWRRSLVAGCAVGPNFKNPRPPMSAATRRRLSPPPSATPHLSPAARPSASTVGADIAADWWTLFHSKPLNDLIEESLKTQSRPQGGAGRACSGAGKRPGSARRVLSERLGGLFRPAARTIRRRFAPVPNSNAFQYNLFTPQVSVSYAPDVFGLNRRTVESLAGAGTGRALSDDRDLHDADRQCGGHGNPGGLGADADRGDPRSSSMQTMVDMPEDTAIQLAKGYASRLDLAAQESQLAQVAATLAAAAQAAGPAERPAGGAGRPLPGAGAGRRNSSCRVCKLPQEVPVSLPSALVAQRPDVLQAEANLHAASAQIGIAVANRLPNIQLTANAGSSRRWRLDQLFTTGHGLLGDRRG
jgi:hypothetical protein